MKEKQTLANIVCALIASRFQTPTWTAIPELYTVRGISMLWQQVYVLMSICGILLLRLNEITIIPLLPTTNNSATWADFRRKKLWQDNRKNVSHAIS